MDFAMNEGGWGGPERVSIAIYIMIFFKTPFRIIYILRKCVLHIVWAIYYVLEI